MKLLIPNRRDRFRAEQDIDCRYGQSMQKGTVFRVDKTRVNQAATDDEAVQVTILMGETPELTMKKYGGTAAYGHHRTVSNFVLRCADVSLVEGME
jgi:hypothetical protein